MDENDLLRWLLSVVEARWPLKCASIAPLKVRENAVYAVHLHDGAKVALRVHRCGYHSDVALESERTWLQALGLSGFAVPQHVLSSAGHSFERVRIEGFEGERQLDIFQWINGQQLGSVEAGVALTGASVGDIYREVGRLAARLHNHSATWEVPVGFRRHAWDAAGLVGETPLWGRFWDLEALSPSERQLLVRLRQAVSEELNEFGVGRDRYGLIHADLVPENVLVDGNKMQLIDFDDAGYGWHLFEIATSLYFIRRESIYEEARSAVIEGYREQRPLPDAHIAKLPMFLAARGSTYLGWVHTRRAEPAAQEMTATLVQMAVAAAEDYFRVR